jgi:hypothetical protein
MGAGVQAVEGAIGHAFGPGTINARTDAESLCTVLSFRAEGRSFVVFVSDEFDQDFPSVTANLNQLESKLRSSTSGRVTVKTTGITQR